MNIRTVSLFVFLLLLSSSPFAGAEEDTSLSFRRDPLFSDTDRRLDIQDNLIAEQDQPFLKKGLVRSLNIGGSWVPDRGNDGAGITEFKLGLTLACPAPKCKPFANSFFLFSPNFTYTNIRWSGSEFFPDNLYSAGLSVTWMKPLNERWSVMASASPGYASDGKASRDNVRCPAVFGATWTPNKKWKVLMGVAYLNRSDIPVLPFGGFTYTPNDDWKFECMAPQPRIARRLTFSSSPKMERWVYVGGGFGGGTWAIDVYGQSDLAMYREYSVLLGYESNNKFRSFQWNAEIAFLFGREMQFEYDTQPNRKLANSLALRLRCSL